ncbi:ABC transporter permease [Actinomycetaceae bacterium WB03_NA08]|uniref:Autoinducer 2 import system permease protein LsrC n=1 Tax=Scrofimicrobium canadense TaxID=2652290 RepID=A0A6N7VRJ7_9ACTO|nr:ABC transporter permease [Scrofimicrobium canadense]MSS84389.1 ABC transporter permease [Scrofimicrobium canadense]
MSTVTATKPASAAMRWFSSVVRSREFAIVLAFLLLVLATTLKNPRFIFSPDGWRDLLVTPSMLLVVAIGQAVVIISRNVDLSVGSVMGLTAYCIGSIFIAVPEMPVILGFVIGIAFGTLLGCVNGALVAFGRVPGMVITLGTLYVFRGINVMWTGSNRINASELPKGLLNLGTESILTIPILTIIAVAILLIVAWYMANTRGGREYYAVGSDPVAAELYGLPSVKRVFLSFVISGAMAGLAGVIFAARYGTIDSQVGSGFELQAVGAAVIGGVAIVGGSGTVIGAAFGAILLTTISRSLPVLGIPDFWQQAVVGALIVGAIVLDRILALRQSQRLVAQRFAEEKA